MCKHKIERSKDSLSPYQTSIDFTAVDAVVPSS